MARRNVRVIARLDIKGPNLIKGIQLEGLRVVGDPQEFARCYYDAGIDELLYIDIVASLYNRNSLSEIVRRASECAFIPMTVGGGVRSVEDAKELLRAGADKIAINTAATARPELIGEVAAHCGAQAMVLSIEAKKISEGRWEAYTDNGREKTGLDVVEWVQRGVELGAGEVLVTSVDREGTQKGFDIELCAAVAAVVEVPLIVSGGLGTAEHARAVVEGARPDAVAVAHALHYGKLSVADLRVAIEEATPAS